MIGAETRALVAALEANLGAELASKTAQCALLDLQENAVRSADPAELERLAPRMLSEIDAGAARARERAELMSRLAASLDLAPCRVAIIAGALRDEGRRLADLRQELRAVTARSLVRGRRLAVLVRAHGGLLEEALGRFLAPDATGAPLGRGSLVDARA